MLGLAQAGSGEDNSCKNIVLKTSQGSPSSVLIGDMVGSQTVDARAQQVLADEETWNKTIIADDLSGQANCVFVAGESLDQGDKIDIDLD